MTGEVINVLDKQASQDGIDKLGVLLVDMREAIKELTAKEAPEQPDTSKPVIDAISKLERALTSAVSSQKAPVVNVPNQPAPVVNVDAPDFSKVEKALKEIPAAFDKAIKGITIPENDDTNILQALSDLNEQLASIDTAVRMQPQAPTTVGISGNVTSVDPNYATRIDDTTTANTTYIGKATIGSATSSAVWQISKLDTSSGLIKTWADGNANFDNIWGDPGDVALLTYN
jgi:hypothetical protein